MSFNTIVLNGYEYNSIGAGTYQLASIDFGSPADIIKVSPGKLSGNKKLTTCSLSRHIEVDVAIGTTTERRKASIIIQFQIPQGFTASEVSYAATSLAAVLVDDSFVRRMLLGES